MARLTVAFGAALILIGVITYLRTEWRSYGLYAAAGLVLLLLALGTLRGTFGLLGGEVSSATVINAVLLVASVGFVALCVRDLRGRNRGYGAR
jgi:hypothetical protein